MASQPFVGIDFGTCNSSVAWFNPKSRQAEPLRNAEGEDKTPSVVYYGPSEKTLVGKYAEERLAHAEGRKWVLSAVKRELARPRSWLFGERQVSPVEAAADILKKLKRDAEEGHFHSPVTRAVITCPAVFDEAEKDKLREAAALAGFVDIELLEEPVAAAVAYAQAGVEVGRSVLVYDLGGGTFDVALLVREDGEETHRLAMEPRGERLGGEDFDRAVYDYFDQMVQKKRNRPLCPTGIDLAFLRQCRRWKETLSVSEETAPFDWRVPGLGTLTNLLVSRARLERLIESPVARTIALTRAVRDEAAAAGFAVNTVILIGGSSRMPLILQRLKETLDIEPRKWEKQDIAVALGAACHAQALWGEKQAVAKPPPIPLPPELPPPLLPVEPSKEARGFLRQAQAAFDHTGPQPRLEVLAAALRCAQAACDLEPHWTDPLYLKGRILQERREWALAAAAYTAELRLDAQATRAYRGRGFCRLMTADNAGAKNDFDEAIRRAPTEPDYRGRALAHRRLDNQALAAADLERALAAAEPTTPRAALCAIHGLLLRDELGTPDKAVAAFAEALRAMPQAPDPVALFGVICDLFGVTARLLGEQTTSAVSRTAAIWQVALQRALWQACKLAHGGCTRPAVATFRAQYPHEIEPGLWERDPDLAFHLASIAAEHNNASDAVVWLRRLFKANPAFDVRLAQHDAWISKLPDRLSEILTPRLAAHEQHGRVFNHLTVTNNSPFRVTAVTVTVTIQRSGGEKEPPSVQHLAALDAGASHRWANFFKDTSLFGGKLTVHVTVACAEGRAVVLQLLDAPPQADGGQPAPSAGEEGVLQELATATARSVAGRVIVNGQIWGWAVPFKISFDHVVLGESRLGKGCDFPFQTTPGPHLLEVVYGGALTTLGQKTKTYDLLLGEDGDYRITLKATTGLWGIRFADNVEVQKMPGPPPLPPPL